MQSKPVTIAGKSTQRQSNIELLRIIAMVFIVAHHFSVHSGFGFSTDTISINRLWVQWIQLGGKIGVNVFVLISGYFMISADAIKTNKIVKFWAQIFFYSILFFALFVVFGMKSFGIKELIRHCFPITFSQWWFASTYFVMYIVSPYINKLLRGLEKARYIRLLLLLGVFWCIIPTFTGQAFESNNLLWFFCLYALAGYFKLFGCPDSVKGVKYILLALLCMVLTFASAVLLDVVGTKISFVGQQATFFYEMQSLPILASAVFLFVGFLKTDMGYNKVINFISPAMFGVYLIHDHRYVSEFLWIKVFSNASYSESGMLILHTLLVIFVVFVGCVLVELVRLHFIEKYCRVVFDRVADWIDRINEALVSMVLRCLGEK